MMQQKQTQRNCRSPKLSFPLILQATENTKQCLPLKGINMAEETEETVGFGWSRVKKSLDNPQCSNTHKPEEKQMLNYINYLT
jgi:hypothetical protein